MHAIEEAKGCMQKGKDFNRLQAKGDTIFRGEAISDYDPFLDMDSLIAQIPCLVGSSQPLLLVYTVLHKGWISEQTVSVSGVRP